MKLDSEQYGNYDLVDRRISNIIVIHLYLLACKNMLVNVNDFLYSYNGIFNILITIVFVFLYLRLFIFKDGLSRIRATTFGILIAIAAFFLITFLFDNVRFISNEFPYSYVNKQLRQFIAYSLPLFISVSCLKSTDCLLKKLYDNTFFPFLISTITFFLSLQPHSNGVYMAYGNAVMLLSIILLFKYRHTKNWVHLMQFFATTIYILISGSRGPLLSIIIAIILYIMMEKKKNYVLIFLIIISLASLLFCYEQIAVEIVGILDKYNISSRTLNMLLSGKIFNDSNRNEYHQTLIDAINQSPIIGLGAFGGEATVGLAHNLYLDVFANFGYILGSIFIWYIVLKNLYMVVKYKDESISDLLIICSVILLPRGFFDGNLWGTKELWMMMGLFIQQKSVKIRTSFDYCMKQES